MNRKENGSHKRPVTIYRRTTKLNSLQLLQNCFVMIQASFFNPQTDFSETTLNLMSYQVIHFEIGAILPVENCLHQFHS